MDLQKVWNGIDKLVDYTDEHKEQLIVVGSLIFGGYKAVEKITGNIARAKRAKEDRYHREREVYDRSAGVYLKLNRPMTYEEQYEYSLRTRHGESPAKVLADMGLLSRNRSYDRYTKKIFR